MEHGDCLVSLSDESCVIPPTNRDLKPGLALHVAGTRGCPFVARTTQPTPGCLRGASLINLQFKSYHIRAIKFTDVFWMRNVLHAVESRMAHASY